MRAPAEAVWEHATTFAGVNHELRPLLRMTAPGGVRRLDPDAVRLGERIGRSWVLLLGVLPLDYDDVTLVELEPGRRFLERSPMLSMRSWQHERSVDADGAGSVVRDRLTFEARLGLPAAPVVRAIFRHRHRRLRARFGEPS